MNAIDWIDVNDHLPAYDTSVLVLIESKPFEMEDGTNLGWRYHYDVARLRPQYKTDRPFWVDAWDHEPFEFEDVVVTHWIPLPGPPVDQADR